MRAEPQPAAYRADPAILELADWLASPVQAADFPATELRFRNDRWAKAIGLDHLGDDAWLRHFGRFEPLPGNLAQPLALKYHGHQFRVYNPEIGDGRGFLYAQMRDAAGRLLDCGTKGSGTTPFSRAGDGRLTLKGAVREILATEMLEAQGVNTSRTLSVVETGEELWRGDEPSPTRSAVMVRLSHGHIRIGTFQRLAALAGSGAGGATETGHMAALVDYCLKHYPGPPPPADAPGADVPAVCLLHQVVERLADLAASWMVAGFVHGVLNTDNMNISGESFDYGPWRWLPKWDAGFTAAYFDQQGLYAFGRQPEALHWNCGQLAVALRQVADAPPLIAALERFGPLYMAAVARRWTWRMGVHSQGSERDAQLVATSEAAMRASGMEPEIFWHRHRGGKNAAGDLADALEGYEPVEEAAMDRDNEPVQSMLIDEVESIWSAIDRSDNWEPLHAKIAAIRRLGNVLGQPPQPAGHSPASFSPVGTD
ncbi:YdiU family protein [Altererythrobacter confluentis]|uniref:Protein nucleotidyltransferase YdiU n=1 Tax=Allopontixanthobacter confluentis TaxID=1849021 RepID=A0A6L7GCU8_9SPHN|nr:YdiU family protein [Allopontixanthobacter confluentis]MXP13737.1 YdiU family protein [Allopontixanthobacter confluentis]